MEPEKKANGAIVGLVIIVVILVIGGIYMWQVNKEKMEGAAPYQSGNTTSQDSELNSLESDLNSTNTSTGVDASTVY